MNTNTNYTDFLKHENELTRLKIQAEFGVMLNGGSEINPAIENIWLNQILEFERAAAENKMTTVGELVGNPDFKKAADLNDEEIVAELQRMMELLHKKNIVIDSVYGVGDREMYRFITEELLITETNSCFPKNMILGFIYEEYHPNAEGDIKKLAADFVNSLASKDEFFVESYFPNDQREEKEVLAQNLMRRIGLFRDAFDNIRMEELTINEVSIAEKKAEVQFDFKLAVLPCESKTYHRISGAGKFDMINENEFWCIDGIVMPGVV